MIMTTVVAVALGLAPVKESAAPQVVSGDYSKIVGRYSQRTDKKGVTHLSGVNQGKAYDLTVAADGRVEGSVGESYVSFTVSDAG